MENEKKEIIKEKCKYCGGDIELRNPTGKCDHLYYPENCEGYKKELKESSIQKVKNVIESLTDDDVFFITITKLYNDGQEDRLSHFMVKNKFKTGDIDITIEEIKKISK